MKASALVQCLQAASSAEAALGHAACVFTSVRGVCARAGLLDSALGARGLFFSTFSAGWVDTFCMLPPRARTSLSKPSLSIDTCSRVPYMFWRPRVSRPVLLLRVCTRTKAPRVSFSRRTSVYVFRQFCECFLPSLRYVNPSLSVRFLECPRSQEEDSRKTAAAQPSFPSSSSVASPAGFAGSAEAKVAEGPRGGGSSAENARGGPETLRKDCLRLFFGKGGIEGRGRSGKRPCTTVCRGGGGRRADHVLLHSLACTPRTIVQTCTWIHM